MSISIFVVQNPLFIAGNKEAELICISNNCKYQLNMIYS